MRKLYRLEHLVWTAMQNDSPQLNYYKSLLNNQLKTIVKNENRNR